MKTRHVKYVPYERRLNVNIEFNQNQLDIAIQLKIYTLTERSREDEECNDGEMLTSNSQGFKFASSRMSNPNSS